MFCVENYLLTRNYSVLDKWLRWNLCRRVQVEVVNNVRDVGDGCANHR